MVLGLVVPPERPGVAAARDPAARGLDLFVHVPSRATAGARLAVQLRVFGFPTVATLAPLAGARVEAAWDPESLDVHAAAAPPVVTATCDGAGRAHLEVAVPHGRGIARLLLSARWADHQRTREVNVVRLAARQIDLRVSDTAVVPGGSVSAWLFVRDLATGQAAADVPVDLSLREGSVARFSRRLITDRAGMAAALVPVPFTDDSDWKWTLNARTAVGDDDDLVSAELRVRDETPSAPEMSVRWAQRAAAPGTRATFRVEARDGTHAPMARLPVRYWVGPRGTEAPQEEAAWQRASTAAVTDIAGAVTVTVDTPATISRRGSSLNVVARAEIGGHPLSGNDTLALQVPRPTLRLVAEHGALVPGQPQHLFLHAAQGEQPIGGEFALEGHGLAARLRTNARGWGETLWNVPREIGATVPGDAGTGCAGEVAATVHIRALAPIAGLAAHPRPFDVCVTVERDAVAAVRPARPLVRAGEDLPVRLIGGRAGAPASRSSVVLAAPGDVSSTSAWLDDVAGGGKVRVPDLAHGLWTISAAQSLDRERSGARGATPAAEVPAPDASSSRSEEGESASPGAALSDERRRLLPGSVLVVPRVLPLLQVTRAPGGRAAPGGSVDLDADLSDGHGQPLTGSVGAVVIDKQGGAHPENLLALDTRRALVAPLGIADEDATTFLDGDGGHDVERWAALAQASPVALRPVFDPAATVDAEIDKVFGAIVRSLEGGVFESSGDPQRLADVRIRQGNGFVLNPEMLTLTTDAMSTPPTTPGGEPWRLADLMAIDRQVSYDNVARRVTRLKLLRVLESVRAHFYENRLGPDEPMLRDPNALLRRLVRSRVLEPADLLDPWAHNLRFVRSGEARVPFLSLVPGYRLLSAGRDGRYGTADDIRDPFQRVLASRTPYARAVEEDRIVDARWDMRVGDETVEAWKKTLEELTGSALGDKESGQGYGSGTGGLGGVGTGSGGGGTGRASFGVELGPAIWLPPARTDQHGHVRLTIPLPGGETTWQVLLVAVADQGSPAVTSVDVPVALPLSLAVDTGASWIAGDQVGVSIAVRNRTDRALAASLRIAASGAAALVEPAGAIRVVQVPAGSSATVIAMMRATAPGSAALDVGVSAPGAAPDAVRHQWLIKPAGERSWLTSALWLDREATIALPAGDAGGAIADGPGRLVLERGLAPALDAALDSLRPDRLVGVRALADALEVAGRVRSWAIARGGAGDALAVGAHELAGRVAARLDLHPGGKRSHATEIEEPLRARARLWQAAAAGPAPALGASGADAGRRDSAERGQCPPSSVATMPAQLDWLELAPAAGGGAEPACWAAFVTSALQRLAASSDPLWLARAVLAVRDRPGQAIVAGALADRLRAAAPVRSDGALVLPAAQASDRAARAIVMAALTRARKLGTVDATVAAAAARVWPRLLAERDPAGGYGSAQATRIVVAALLEADPAVVARTTIRWSEIGRDGRAGVEGSVTLAASGSTTIALPPTATGVHVESSAPGVLARVERLALRPFGRPLDPTASPLHFEIDPPRAAAAESTSLLQISLRHDLGRGAAVVARIPLPPGAALAERVDDIRQVQGALYLRATLDSDPLPRVIAVPVRFALSGTVTWPEATARIDDDELPTARAPARPLVIRGRK
ncbi:MAG TPA: alpha-2-macroglobulin family protein [Polyangia bacterium]|nr:alpha-2-macroglobulin family protein [Polyangia bacterium]